MIDKAKVMLGLQIHALSTKCEDDGHYCPYFASDECSLLLCKDTLELLKEQPGIVRCRECIRRGTYNCPIYVGGDADHGSPDDWYCADGERG